MKRVLKFVDLLKNPLVLAIAGNVAMLTARIGYTKDLFYGFLLWNLFLAAIPLLLSNLLIKTDLRIGFRFCFLLGLWLLFLPNAPYIITDLKHLVYRPPVPFWFDMLLVLITAFNGLILGFISLKQMEWILDKKQLTRYKEIFRIVIVVVMSYGVYLGRYLRFNSWDIFINPITLVSKSFQALNFEVFAYVLTYSFVIYVLYKFFHVMLPVSKIFANSYFYIKRGK